METCAIEHKQIYIYICEYIYIYAHIIYAYVILKVEFDIFSLLKMCVENISLVKILIYEK